jgi:hypothetical protein
MALRSYSATIKSDGSPSLGKTPDASAAVVTAVTDAATAVAAAPSTAAVAAALAVLVADGASPTQAHVNTLNTAWGTLLTAIGTLNTAVLLVQTDVAAASGDVGADVAVSFNPDNVLTKNNFRGALRAIINAVEGSNHLTGA